MVFLRQIALRTDAATLAVGLALGCVMLATGGGVGAPVAQMVGRVMLAIGVCVWCVYLPGHAFRAVGLLPWLLVGLICLLPVCQLVPLPPSVWQALPGRQSEYQALALVGQQNSWRPLSMTPDRTLNALLSMLGAAMFIPMVASLSRNGRTLVLGVIVAVALASLVVGAVQITGGINNPARFFDQYNQFLTGFQSNHNSEAELLLIAMVALGVVVREVARLKRLAIPRSYLTASLLAGSLTLLFGVMVTASRTGIILALPVLGVEYAIVRGLMRRGPSRPVALGRRWYVAGLAVILVAVGALWTNQTLSQAFARFTNLTEFRPKIWHDTGFAVSQIFPWGAGMGSFVPMFEASEHLEIISNLHINRAHDDYLELLLEGGLPGVVLLGVIVTILVALVWIRLRDTAKQSRGQILCGATGLAIFAVQSVLDYPLRTMSMSCVGAALVGMLMALPAKAGASDRMEECT